MELRPTAKAILGTLSFGPKSGYEIKSMIDHSARFFWAASYGQIYPELKRLAEAGLVAGEDDPQGGRARTTWSLTPDGEKALHDWLATPPEVFEMRNEGMLKVFFAGSLEPAAQIERVRDLGRLHGEKVEALREVEASLGDSPAGYPDLILRFGIEFNEWVVEWCESTAARLESEINAERST